MSDAAPDAGPRTRHVVLEFAAVCMPGEAAITSLPAVELVLTAGSLSLIDVADWRQAMLLAGAAVGLIAPRSGHVSFLGRDWASLPSVYACALRGRIGHVFRTGNWIDSLTMLDNILLPHAYHTRRAAAEMSAEAARLATALGLPGVPTGYPSELSAADRQRSACVRAFLGRPALVILEEPLQGLPTESKAALINLIRRARDRDAAVVWLTDDRGIWTDLGFPASCRYRLRDTLYRIGGDV